MHCLKMKINLGLILSSICLRANLRDVLDGAETRAKWIKDIMDGLGKLCGDTALHTRERELHGQMETMETALKSLIEIRNRCPFDHLDM